MIFCSSDGINFPTNAANVAKNSPLIRRVLKEWREDQVIYVDVESKALSIILSLFYGISIPFKGTLNQKVKDALKLFEIDDSAVRIVKQEKETGEKEDLNVEAKVNHEDEHEQPASTVNTIQTRTHIDCPFPNCSVSSKQKNIFLKHLCDKHFKDELENLMKEVTSERSCAHEDCEFQTHSNNKRNLRYHIAIKHKHINILFANKFPENPLIKELKLT